MQDTRERLIHSVYTVVSEKGIEGATTKSIAFHANTAEVMIYKRFGNKEGLLLEAFRDCDRKLNDVVAKCADSEESLQKIWRTLYRALVAEPIRTEYMIRYRYSAFYRSEDMEPLLAAKAPVVRAMSRYIPMPESEEKFEAMLCFVFELLLSVAEKVVSNRYADTALTEGKCMEMIDTMLSVYFPQAV